MRANIKVLSFDLDNTLWDTPPVLAVAEERLRAWLAVNAPAMFATYTQKSFSAHRDEVLGDYPQMEHDVSFIRIELLKRLARGAQYPESLALEAFELFLTARQNVTLYPDVADNLDWAARRFKLAAITNGNACVYRTGLGHWFDESIDPRSAGVAKPHPKIFEQLIERVGVGPAEICHIGDDPLADVKGALEVGMTAVWVNRQGLTWSETQFRPNATVRDLHELKKFLTNAV